MAEKYGIDFVGGGPILRGPGLPSREDQLAQREKAGMGGNGFSFVGSSSGSGRRALDPTGGRPTFVAKRPRAELPVPEPSGDTRFSDYTRSLGAGLIDIAEGIAGTIELTGIVPQGSITGPLADQAAEVIANTSPSHQENLRRQWASLDKESVLANPKAALAQLARVFPSVAASLGGGVAGAAVNVGRLGKTATAAQRARAAGAGGAAGAAATEAAQVAGSTMTEIANMMNQVPHDQLVSQSPTYRRNFNRLGDEGEARRQTILEASRSAAVGNALFSALTAMLPGYVVGKQAQRLGPKSRLARTGQVAGAEGTQEAVQEAGTGLGTGTAYQEHIDRTYDPTADLPERALAGFALGGMAGGVVGGVMPGERPPPGEAAPEPDQGFEVPPDVRAALEQLRQRGASQQAIDEAEIVQYPPAVPAPYDVEEISTEEVSYPPHARMEPYVVDELPPEEVSYPPSVQAPTEESDFLDRYLSEAPQPGQLDLPLRTPARHGGPGAQMGPPQPPPRLSDGQAQPGIDATALADDLLLTLAGRQRYTYIPPNLPDSAQEALRRMYERVAEEFRKAGGDVRQGLLVEQDSQGGTLVTRNPNMVDAFQRGQPLPRQAPSTNRPSPVVQEELDLFRTPPTTPTPPYPGGMTREEFEAADSTLKARREDRARMKELANVIKRMDAERIAAPPGQFPETIAQPDLLADEARSPVPQRRKSSYAVQLKQMEAVAKNVERLAEQGELTEDARREALDTVDQLALTKAAEDPAFASLYENFDLARQLVESWQRGESGATETLNYFNELLGGKQGDTLKTYSGLKEVKKVLSGEPKAGVQRSGTEATLTKPARGMKGIVSRIKAAQNQKRPPAKKARPKFPQTGAQKDLFPREKQAETTRQQNKKAREAYEKEQAEQKTRATKREKIKKRIEKARQDRLTKEAERQWEAKQKGAKFSARRQRLDTQLEQSDADQRTLEMLKREQAADIAAEETTSAEESTESEATLVELGDIEGRATGELAIEGEGSLVLSNLDKAAAGGAEPAPSTKPSAPPKGGKRKKRELTDEERRFRDITKTAAATAGGVTAGTVDTPSGERRRASVKASRVPSQGVKATLSRENFAGIFPRATVTPADYQYEGVNIILSRAEQGAPGVILGDGTGTGKTLQTVMAAEMFRRQGKRVLLVKTTSEGEKSRLFLREFAKLGLDPNLFDETTYMQLGKVDTSYDVVLYDEAHMLKNTGSTFYTHSRALGAPFEVYVTATPGDADQGLTLLALAEGRTNEQLAKELGVRLSSTGTVPVSDFDNDLMERLEKVMDRLQESGAFFRREIPRITETAVIDAEIWDQPFTDEISGDSRTLAEWDNSLAASKSLNKNQYWAASAKIAETAKLPEVIKQVLEALTQERKVIVMAGRHEDKPIEWLDNNNNKHRIRVPSILDLVEEFLESNPETAELVLSYYGKTEKRLDAWQTGDKQVLLTTYGKASESIDLDDQVGNAPRTLISTLSDWSAIKEDQAIGRVDRANTASVPRFVSLRAKGFTADRVRTSRAISKHGVLGLIHGNEKSELSYADNVSTTDRGDRIWLQFVGMYYRKPQLEALGALVKEVAGKGNWEWNKRHEVWSIDKSVWPKVDEALRYSFSTFADVSNLETAPETETATESLPEPEETTAEIEEQLETPVEEAENPLFFDRAAEKLARQYEISVDDLEWEGNGPAGTVTAADVERYWNQAQGQASFSMTPSTGVLVPDVSAPVTTVLRTVLKSVQRSSPMYDLVRTLSRHIRDTTIQLDDQPHRTYAGMYYPGRNEIKINPLANTEKTIIHEALHAALHRVLDTNLLFRQKVTKLRDEFLAHVKADQLSDNARALLETMLASNDPNGHEFVSYALTEPELQRVLMSMPSKYNPQRSLWQKFKAMVAKVLRLNRRARTAFDDLVDLAKEGVTQRQDDTAPYSVEPQFSVNLDAARPIYEAVQRVSAPRTRQQARSAVRRTATGALTLRQLASFYEGVLERLEMQNPVRRWIDALHRKEVTMKKYAAKGNERYREYRRIEAENPDYVKSFRGLITDSTIEQIYADLPLDHKLNEGVDSDKHFELREVFQNLPKAMQEEYTTLREFYRDEREFELRIQIVNALLITDASLIKDDREVKIDEALATQVANDILSGKMGAAEVVLVADGEIDYHLSRLLQERLKENREHMLARGPYFPLKRFGQFTAYGEKDHATARATLSHDELKEIDEKAATWVIKRTEQPREEWGQIASIMFNNRRDHLRRSKLTDKLNKIIREKTNDPRRQRSPVQYGSELTSATREHYDVYYSQHETAEEAYQAAKQLRAWGYTVAEHEGDVKVGRRPDDIPRSLAAFGPLLSSLRARLETKAAKQGSGKGSEYDRLFKALESSLLSTLPETSVRLETLKRKNVPGSTNDAGRALAAHVRSRGYYRGALLHGQEIGEAMVYVNVAHRAVERDAKYSQPDQDRVQAVMDEIRKHDAIDSAGNEIGEVSRGLANVGFLWVLLSPVYILINMTQPGMFTLPWLAARSKTGGAMQAARFLKQAYSIMMPEFIARSAKARLGIFGGKLNVDQELFDFLDPDGESVGETLLKRINESDLPEDRKAEIADMLAKLAAANLLDMTLAADTRSAAAGREHEAWWERTMDSARILPHLTEVLNRGVTAIAAYQMGRTEGMSKEEALGFAEEAIAETQFDYSLLNKPRYMSERVYSAAKPIFMFMQHPQHVYALFIKSTLFGTRGAKKYYRLKMAGEFDPTIPEHAAAEREYKMNRDTVLGILGTHLLMGGVAGAFFEPAKWALGFALLINEMITGEPPEDTKTYVHRWVTNIVGEEAGELAMHGLPWAFGANLSANLSVSTLATFDTRYKEGREGFQDRVFSLLGPLPALGGNIMEGIKDIKDGDVIGGIARMSPRTLRELVRAAKASDVGLQDSRGNVLIDADKLSPYELTLNALGINTAQKSRMYENRAATLNLKYGHRDKQTRLKERLKRADTPGKRRAALADIARYNRSVPVWARINIYGSQAASTRTQRQLDKGGGVILGTKERHLAQDI